MAGVDLVRKVFEQTAAITDQEHLNVALLSCSENVRDRSEFLFGRTRRNPAIEIAASLVQLDAMGCDVAAIACLTSHSPRIYDEIISQLRRSGTRLRLLHAVEEVAAFCRQYLSDVDVVGVLATSGSVNSDLFGPVFGRCGLTAIYPDPDVQGGLVHDAIYNAKHGIKAAVCPTMTQARNQLMEAAQHLIDKGAEAIVLGCTEIPLVISDSTIAGRTLIDPAVVVARSLIRHVAPEKLRPLAFSAFANAVQGDLARAGSFRE